MINQSKCWNCEENISYDDIFCSTCKVIQSPAPIDYFTKMGMESDFEIGRKNLDVAYFALQRKLHPDLFTNKSEREKALSMQQTMEINAAYETLKSPLSRAEYILSLNNIVVNKDNRESVRPNPELLIESLESREELENTSDVRAMLVKTTENRITCIDNIKDNLSANQFDDAAQNTIRLRYLEKLLEEIKKK